MSDYLTAKEAAERLGVDASQVRRYCGKGLLPARKLGRDWLIRQEDLGRFRRPPIGAPRREGMDMRTARRLTKVILDAGCHVTGTRHYGKDSYSLDVVDPRTGIPFVVHSVEQWEERVRESQEER